MSKQLPKLVEARFNGDTQTWRDVFAWHIDPATGEAFCICLADGSRVSAAQLEEAMGENPEPDNGDPEYAFRVPVYAKDGERYIAALCFQHITGNGYGSVLYIPPDGWVPRFSYDDLSGIPAVNIIGNDDAVEDE